jgi:Ni,Fe-hydrogenase maturation factor
MNRGWDNMSYSDRASVIAVGVENYRYMQNLSGPSKDLEKMKNLLSTNVETALYPGNRFTQLIDPDSNRLRKIIVDYAMARSAPNDILVFYFSGHGVLIGNDDLGLCTVETQMHPEFKAAFPLNLVRFSDIVETLSAVKVDPVIIIDACFSGQAGSMIAYIYNQLKRSIQAETASTYALLCSSRKIETTPDHQEGGPFSSVLVNVAKKGKDSKNFKRKEELSLIDLHNDIRTEIESLVVDIVPQLFIGDTLPDFGFIRK